MKYLTMKNVLLSFSFLLSCFLIGNADACTNVSTETKQTFFVSGVMKKNDEEATIKLMHSVVQDRSENEALQSFVRAAIKQYPEYKMVSVLASKEVSISCQKSDSFLSV